MEDLLKFRLQSFLALKEIFFWGLWEIAGTKKTEKLKKIIKNKIEKQRNKRKRDKKIRFLRERMKMMEGRGDAREYIWKRKEIKDK